MKSGHTTVTLFRRVLRILGLAMVVTFMALMLHSGRLESTLLAPERRTPQTDTPVAIPIKSITVYGTESESDQQRLIPVGIFGALGAAVLLAFAERRLGSKT